MSFSRDSFPSQGLPSSGKIANERQRLFIGVEKTHGDTRLVLVKKITKNAVEIDNRVRSPNDVHAHFFASTMRFRIISCRTRRSSAGSHGEHSPRSIWSRPASSL